MSADSLAIDFDGYQAFEQEAIFDKPGEECGVFGVYAPGMDVAGMAHEGLKELQHRGQEGAGIATAYGQGRPLEVCIGLGRVPTAFLQGERLDGLSPDAVAAMGQVRYATSKSANHHLLSEDERKAVKLSSLQPMLHRPEPAHLHDFAIAHNGHLENVRHTARQHGVTPTEHGTDTEDLLEMVKAEYELTGVFPSALLTTLNRIQGAYALVGLAPHEMYGVNDPQGFRPLSLGRLASGRGWVLASEVDAITVVGAEVVREIEPGEMVRIDSAADNGVHSERFAEAKPAHCGFEFVYFSKPNNVFAGEKVSDVRFRMGELLAARDMVAADRVIGVPASGIWAARGYSERSGIPIDEQALTKKLNADRSFIEEDQAARLSTIDAKFDLDYDRITGQRVVVIDDSFVRGNTAKALVAFLHQAGATEVHYRSASPPYIESCYFGMATRDKELLIASHMTVQEMREHIGANSLLFLNNDEMEIAAGTAAGKLCNACTTGNYPIPVNVDVRSRVA